MPILNNKKNLLHLLPIKTLRLKLINIDPRYAEDVIESFTPNVEKYMVLKSSQNLEDTESELQKKLKENESGRNLELMILDTEDNFIGMCGLLYLDEEMSHFTIWLSEKAWGKGYGTEAIHGMYNAVQGHLSYKELNYPVEENNYGSQKIAKSLGGTVKDSYTITNKNGEENIYLDFRMN